MGLHPPLPVSTFQGAALSSRCSLSRRRMVAQAGSGTGYFNLYLKSAGYSVVDTNVLPTAGNAISVVAAFLAAGVVDATGARLTMSVIVQLTVMVSNVLLAVWNIPDGAKMFAFFLSYAGSAAQPIIIVSVSLYT